MIRLEPTNGSEFTSFKVSDFVTQHHGRKQSLLRGGYAPTQNNKLTIFTGCEIADPVIGTPRVGELTDI